MTAVQMAAALPAASPVAVARRSDGGEFARHLESASSPAGGTEGEKGSSASVAGGAARKSGGSAEEQGTADAPTTVPGTAPLAEASDSEGEASMGETAHEIVVADSDAVADVGAGSDPTPVAVDTDSAAPSEALAEETTPGDDPAAIVTAQTPGGASPTTGSRAPIGPGTPPVTSTTVGPETPAMPSAGAAAPAQPALAAGPGASAGLAAASGEVAAQPTAAPAVTAGATATGASGQETQARIDGVAVTASGPTTTTSASPAAPAAPPPAPAPPLAPQLAPQLSHLRQLPQGEHVLTLSVTPDTFGPVKVVAHITAEGTTVQLLGSTEAGREALRAALADLRRDLAATGLDARLDVGSGRGEAGSPDGRGARTGTRDTLGTVHGGHGEPAALTSTPAPVADRSRGVDLFL